MKIPGVIEAVAVGDEGIDQSAEIEQVIPVAIIAGELRDLERENDTDMAQPDLGDKPLEAGADNATPSDAEIVIDDNDL